jgi:hypothetical protein
MPTKKSRRNHGEFSGDPEALWLVDTDLDEDRRMRLLKEFWFKDPRGKKWKAPLGYSVDGASIPRALWSLIGSPYTGDYRRASVVHDKACDDANDDSSARRLADKMFYHACREGGCSIFEATLLYIGVRIGAMTRFVPTWSSAVAADVGPRMVRTPAEDRLEADFRVAAALVLRRGETDNPSELEKRTDDALSFATGIDLRSK